MAIKTLHLISSLTRGGRERQLATIVANTDMTNYPTKIIYFNKKQHSYIDEYDLNDYSIQIKETGKLKRLKKLLRVLKKEKPDVVYTWGNGESLSILLLSPFHRFKFINGSIRHGIRSKKFSHYFRTLVLHLSPNIVANSKAGLKANNLRRGKMLYNGIEDKFLEPLNNKLEIRNKLTGIPENTPLLISVANLVPYKDYFSILAALKSFKEAGHDFYYLVLGDGPMREEIEQTISAYNLNQNIRIVGNVENVADYLKISDIFIHSSKGEGCSNAILEAMAAGLPVVASDTGGTSEITDNTNSILFHYKNVEELKNGILYYLQNNHARDKAGKRSKQIIYERFTTQRMMEVYYKIMNTITKH
jgi:glycosyltransferase involved in cell wall biosynthesis